jgi:drug/metabolite transporter (DMT)-like permease
MIGLILISFLGGLIRTNRNLLLTSTETINYNFLFFIQLLTSLILIPFLFFFKNNSISNIFLNILKNPSIYLYFFIAQIAHLLGSYFFYKSYFSDQKKREYDNDFISIIVIYSLPLIISALIYNILGIEKYSFTTYIYILLIIIGNIGVVKYWNN